MNEEQIKEMKKLAQSSSMILTNRARKPEPMFALKFEQGYGTAFAHAEPLVKALQKIVTVSGSSCEHYHIAEQALKAYGRESDTE